jgi:hypothetical protein
VEAFQRIAQQAFARTANAEHIDLCFGEVSRGPLNFGGGVCPDNPAGKRLHLFRLGIIGASVMGTSGAHNPTLTAQALAWRTAEHLTGNWNAIAKG